MKLHQTYQPNQFYTDLSELPKHVQDALIYSDIEIRQGFAYVETEAEIDGVTYRIELSLLNVEACVEAYIEDSNLGDDLGYLTPEETDQVNEYIECLTEDMRGCIENTMSVYLEDISE